MTSLLANNLAADTPAATLTCRCGHSESFAGDLLHSIEASQDSQRWFTDQRGFFVCAKCAEATQ